MPQFKADKGQIRTLPGIVKQNQGFISIYSELGMGATFRIYLPSAEGVAEFAPPPETPRKPPNGAETILLVEDEDSLRELARVCLQSAGYIVLEARNGQEAIDIGRQYGGNIQLLLTDVVMPGISGSTLAATLVKTQPAMRVLFMSGCAYDIVTRHGVLSPGVALLEKPVTISSLLTKVREVLDADLVNVGRTN
jgi:two-component system, cell cycle sensor histidine kinase and response regulator CckA